MKILRLVYWWWISICFLLIFFLLYPVFLIFLQSKKTLPIAHKVNSTWGWLTFIVSGIIPRVKYKQKFKHNRTAVYCANHTSYLDILMSFMIIPGYFTIIAKHSLTKLPLFGYMFNKMYISVNRSSKISRFRSYQACLDAVKGGRSLVVYPEGTIPKDGAPLMIPFKDGPFRIAIETNAPIIPVTFPDNWVIYPDDRKRQARFRWPKMIFHEPIETTGMDISQADELKDMVYDIIDQEIRKQNKL